MTYYNDVTPKRRINSNTMVATGAGQPEKKTDLDTLRDAFSLISPELEGYIGTLKGAGLIVTQVIKGEDHFNQERYNAEFERVNNTRCAKAEAIKKMKVGDLAKARALMEEFVSLTPPDKDDPKYYDSQSHEVKVNLKTAYHKLTQARALWETRLKEKEHELIVKNRGGYITNPDLLADDECFTAIIELLKHPCVAEKTALCTYALGSDICLYLTSMRDRNSQVFDSCKTVTQYNQAIDDGAFDSESISIPRDIEEKLATQFLSASDILPSDLELTSLKSADQSRKDYEALVVIQDQVWKEYPF